MSDIDAPMIRALLQGGNTVQWVLHQGLLDEARLEVLADAYDEAHQLRRDLVDERLRTALWSRGVLPLAGWEWDALFGWLTHPAGPCVVRVRDGWRWAPNARLPAQGTSERFDDPLACLREAESWLAEQAAKEAP